MRWPRAVFERGRMIGRVSLKEAAPFLSCHVDDHTVTRTAQVALSRRIALRQIIQETRGSANSLFSYRGRDAACQSPGAVVQPKGRTPGVDAKQAVPTAACGTPDASGVTVATTLVCFHYFAHGAADASRIRRSARPHRRAGMQSASGAPAPSQQQGR